MKKSAQPQAVHAHAAQAPLGLPTRMRQIWLATGLLLYLVLAVHQLGLPGLHYDEAKEAGVNAMELLAGAPVSAFRDAALTVGQTRLPLMVQDYIGALNVYLALPFLGVTGIGVPNLRALAVLTGLLTLLTLERALSAWAVWGVSRAETNAQPQHVPISLAGLLAVTLLAASPSFVFWSRQGIFVTNLTQPLVLLALWQGLRWLHTGRTQALHMSALSAGLALYAKLLALWVLLPFALMAGVWWLRQWRAGASAPAVTWRLGLTAGLTFLLPLTPLLLFNAQTGGTFASVSGNLGQSYYGVNNLAVFHNLPVRLEQVVSVLRGDQFWYLGAVHANGWAPWLAAVGVLVGSVRRPRLLLPPLLLTGAAVGLSLFTVSDLFVTHYALLQPLLVGTAALGYATWFAPPWSGIGARVLPAGAALLLALWFVFDLSATVRYHSSLSRSGGLAGHADTSYHLAYHLRYNGMGAPIALDWGFDAPVRFLSEGTVTPIEIFGYASPAEPDPDFGARLAPFLDNPDNVYLLHAPAFTTFTGRREAFFAAVDARGKDALLEATFTQRDGTPLAEVWRIVD